MARRRLRVSHIDQYEVDARNVAVRAVYGRATKLFYTIKTVQDEPPDLFWRGILDAINSAQITPANVARPITLYEHTNIVAIRAHQLAMNAAPQIINVPESNCDCAKKEIAEGRINFQLRRTFLDGTSEYVLVQDLTAMTELIPPTEL